MKGKEATRERILDAATGVIAEKGYHEASMDEIVHASGTSKGALYFHFPSKQALFFALVERLAVLQEHSVQNAVAGEQGAVAKVDAALQSTLNNVVRHRTLGRVLLAGRGGLGPALDRHLMKVHERFARLIQGYLDEAIAEGSLAPVDTELAAFAWLGAINEVVVRWLHTGQPKNLEHALPALRTLLLQSIGLQAERQYSPPVAHQEAQESGL
ncbi:MAG: TetR/AcrR family transcriptional regulator [Chloroflexi bacterium]|nr:TetR/AcrR family transcriptional regulator [Chloroflexota bacterium]